MEDSTSYSASTCKRVQLQFRDSRFLTLPLPGSSASRGERLHERLKSEAETDLDDRTGSAGLIRMIGMYNSHFWVAAVLGTVATVGWSVQGAGNAFYYMQVRPRRIASLEQAFDEYRPQIYKHHTAAGHTIEKVCCIPLFPCRRLLTGWVSGQR